MSLYTAFSHFPVYPPPAEPVLPVIGISGAQGGTTSVMCMMQMIHWAGATPLLLCEHQERTLGSLQLTVLKDISRIHGLIVMSDDDAVDARHASGAAYEDRMIETAIKTRLPLLGIGGGIQRLDALCGGTLHQYHPDLVGTPQPAASASHCDQFLMGVQWHPQHGSSEVGQAVMGSFVEHVREFMRAV